MLRKITLLSMLGLCLFLSGCGITYSKGGSGESYFAGIARYGVMDNSVRKVSLTANSPYFKEVTSLNSGRLNMPDSRPDHYLPSTFTFRWGDNLEQIAVFKPRVQIPKTIIDNLAISDGWHVKAIYSIHLDFRVVGGKAECFWSAPLWEDVTQHKGEGIIYPVSTP